MIAFMAIKSHAFPFWTLINYSQLAMLLTLWVIVSLQRFFETERTLPLLLAGMGIGLTVITKQNQAGFLALASSLAILTHAWMTRCGWAGLIRRGAIGVGGSSITLLPILVVHRMSERPPPKR